MESDGAATWLIAGPTAAGKSALALALAHEIGGEIVNADAMQVYRDLRVLTGRPTADDEELAPHHLYGVADAANAWSVGRWLRAAREILAEIASRGRPAIVVGGSGLYLHALTRGLSDMPPVAPLLRDQVAARLAVEGEETFRANLARDDPEAAARIGRGDRQRLVRAAAVLAATGRPLSQWHTAPLTDVIRQSARVVLCPPREVLYRRCDARLAAMLDAGAEDEVARLLARRLPADVPAMRALGVAPFAACLRGEHSAAAALELARRDTRRYVKRQMTWFRRYASDWPVVTSSEVRTQWREFRALFGLTTLPPTGDDLPRRHSAPI